MKSYEALWGQQETIYENARGFEGGRGIDWFLAFMTQMGFSLSSSLSPFDLIYRNHRRLRWTVWIDR